MLVLAYPRMVSPEMKAAMDMRDMRSKTPREASMSRSRTKRFATFSETGVMFTMLISCARSPKRRTAGRAGGMGGGHGGNGGCSGAGGGHGDIAGGRCGMGGGGGGDGGGDGDGGGSLGTNVHMGPWLQRTMLGMARSPIMSC